MKAKIIMTFILVLMISSVYSQNEDSKKGKKTKRYQETLAIINSGNFNFEADKTFMKGKGMIDLTSNPNYLNIRDGKAEAHLPFFGEIYRINNLSGEVGIDFEGEMSDYNVTHNDDKMLIEIKFKIKTRDDVYNCYMRMSYKTNVSLDINSNFRSHARYFGKIELPEEEKSKYD